MNEYTFDPIKPTDGSKIDEGVEKLIIEMTFDSFLVQKEFSNVPSSKIDVRRVGMPPAMYTPTTSQ